MKLVVTALCRNFSVSNLFFVLSQWY